MASTSSLRSTHAEVKQRYACDRITRRVVLLGDTPRIETVTGQVARPRAGRELTPRQRAAARKELHELAAAGRVGGPGTRIRDTVKPFGVFRGLTFEQIRHLRVGDIVATGSVIRDGEVVAYNQVRVLPGDDPAVKAWLDDSARADELNAKLHARGLVEDVRPTPLTLRRREWADKLTSRDEWYDRVVERVTEERFDPREWQAVGYDTEGVTHLDRLRDLDYLWPETGARLALYLSHGRVAGDLLLAYSHGTYEDGERWHDGPLGARLMLDVYGSDDFRPQDFDPEDSLVANDASAWRWHPDAVFLMVGEPARPFDDDPTPAGWDLRDEYGLRKLERNGPRRTRAGSDDSLLDGWVDMELVAGNDLERDWLGSDPRLIADLTTTAGLRAVDQWAFVFPDGRREALNDERSRARRRGVPFAPAGWLAGAAEPEAFTAYNPVTRRRFPARRKFVRSEHCSLAWAHGIRLIARLDAVTECQAESPRDGLDVLKDVLAEAKRLLGYDHEARTVHHLVPPQLARAVHAAYEAAWDRMWEWMAGMSPADLVREPTRFDLEPLRESDTDEATPDRAADASEASGQPDDRFTFELLGETYTAAHRPIDTDFGPGTPSTCTARTGRWSRRSKSWPTRGPSSTGSSNPGCTTSSARPPERQVDPPGMLPLGGPAPGAAPQPEVRRVPGLFRPATGAPPEIRPRG